MWGGGRACSAAAMRPLRQQVSSRDCHMCRSLSVSRAAPTGSRSTWHRTSNTHDVLLFQLGMRWCSNPGTSGRSACKLQVPG